MSLALRILTGRLIQEGIHEEAVVHSLLTSVIHRIIDFSANNDLICPLRALAIPYSRIDSEWKDGWVVILK